MKIAKCAWCENEACVVKYATCWVRCDTVGCWSGPTCASPDAAIAAWNKVMDAAMSICHGGEHTHWDCRIAHLEGLLRYVLCDSEGSVYDPEKRVWPIRAALRRDIKKALEEK